MVQIKPRLSNFSPQVTRYRFFTFPWTTANTAPFSRKSQSSCNFHPSFSPLLTLPNSLSLWTVLRNSLSLCGLSFVIVTFEMPSYRNWILSLSLSLTVPKLAEESDAKTSNFWIKIWTNPIIMHLLQFLWFKKKRCNGFNKIVVIYMGRNQTKSSQIEV